MMTNKEYKDKRKLQVVYYVWLKEYNELYIGKSVQFFNRLRQHKSSVKLEKAGLLYQRVTDLLGNEEGVRALEVATPASKRKVLSDYGRNVRGEFFFLADESRRFVLDTIHKDRVEVGILTLSGSEEILLDTEALLQHLVKAEESAQPLYRYISQSTYQKVNPDVKKLIMQVSPNDIAKALGLVMDFEY